jgi:hypothetical protein
VCSDRNNVYLWGNSAGFGLGILTDAYKALNIVLPWKYSRALDARSLITLWPQLSIVRHGTHHNPLTAFTRFRYALQSKSISAKKKASLKKSRLLGTRADLNHYPAEPRIRSYSIEMIVYGSSGPNSICNLSIKEFLQFISPDDLYTWIFSVCLS